MVEQSHTCKRHGHTVLVCGLYNNVVTNRAAGFGNIAYTASLGSLNVVSKREECVRADGYAGNAVKILSRLLC